MVESATISVYSEHYKNPKIYTVTYKSIKNTYYDRKPIATKISKEQSAKDESRVHLL